MGVWALPCELNGSIKEKHKKDLFIKIAYDIIEKF
jgi:hypothetical protein